MCNLNETGVRDVSLGHFAMQYVTDTDTAINYMHSTIFIQLFRLAIRRGIAISA